ncbi:MAG: PEGA domain-containing protein, partial [Gammaproteobacteria bacterium]
AFVPQATAGGARSASDSEFRRKPRIAVLQFQTSSDRVKELGLSEAITAMAMTELRNNSNYVIVERSQIRAIIDENTLSQLGLTRSATDKLVEGLDVEVVLIGEVSYLGATIHIDARMVDIRTSRVAMTQFVQTTDIANIRGAISTLVRQMLQEYLRPWMGSLSIASDPGGAEVYIDGAYAGSTALRKPVVVDNLIEGRYDVKIIAGGYIDWRGDIVVLPKMAQTFNIPLIAKPGSMTIGSEPPEAEVYLDNNLMGKTPLTLREVAEGEHDLRIVKETYKEWSRKVVVRSFQPTDVTVTLEVLPAMLVIRSDPVGASVYFKGRSRGTTPLTLSNLTPGEVVLRLTKADYNEWVSSSLLAPNERREIDAVLVRQVGLISFASDPDNADVFLTSQSTGTRARIGTTPIFNYETTVGAYTIEIAKSEYHTASRSILVQKGLLAEVSQKLEEKPGQILVGSVPENARVFMNNVFVGRTPLTVPNVKRGTYVIAMSLPYATSEETVSVFPDGKTEVSHRFQKPKTYVWSALWVTVVTSLLYLGAGG